MTPHPDEKKPEKDAALRDIFDLPRPSDTLDAESAASNAAPAGERPENKKRLLADFLVHEMFDLPKPSVAPELPKPPVNSAPADAKPALPKKSIADFLVHEVFDLPKPQADAPAPMKEKIPPPAREKAPAFREKIYEPSATDELIRRRVREQMETTPIAPPVDTDKFREEVTAMHPEPAAKKIRQPFVFKTPPVGVFIGLAAGVFIAAAYFSFSYLTKHYPLTAKTPGAKVQAAPVPEKESASMPLSQAEALTRLYQVSSDGLWCENAEIHKNKLTLRGYALDQVFTGWYMDALNRSNYFNSAKITSMKPVSTASGKTLYQFEVEAAINSGEAKGLAPLKKQTAEKLLSREQAAEILNGNYIVDGPKITNLEVKKIKERKLRNFIQQTFEVTFNGNYAAAASYATGVEIGPYLRVTHMTLEQKSDAVNAPLAVRCEVEGVVSDKNAGIKLKLPKLGLSRAHDPFSLIRKGQAKASADFGNLELSALVFKGRNRYAVINGAYFAEGDAVTPDILVKEIASRQAVLTKNGTDTTLKV